MKDNLKYFYKDIFRPLFREMAKLPSIRSPHDNNFDEKEWEMAERWMWENKIYDYLNSHLYLPEWMKIVDEHTEEQTFEQIGQIHRDNEKFKADLRRFRDGEKKKERQRDIVWYLSPNGIGIPENRVQHHRLSKALYNDFENLLNDLKFNEEEKGIFYYNGDFYFNLISDVKQIYQKMPAFEFNMDVIANEFKWEKCRGLLNELTGIWFIKAPDHTYKSNDKNKESEKVRRKKQFDNRPDVNKIMHTLWTLSDMIPVVTPNGDLKSQHLRDSERAKLREALLRYMKRNYSAGIAGANWPYEKELVLRLEVLNKIFDTDRHSEIQRGFLYDEYYSILGISVYMERLKRFLELLDQFDTELKKVNADIWENDSDMEYHICSDIWCNMN